jgi:hypothetical protein
MSSEEMEDPVWLTASLSSSGKTSSLRWIPMPPLLRPKPKRLFRPKPSSFQQQEIHFVLTTMIFFTFRESTHEQTFVYT